MRVFIGIALNAEEKAFLKRVQDRIKETALKGNFTHFHNFHTTIRFIGDISIAQVDDVVEAMDLAASNIQSFFIKIGDIGAFERGRKKIMWVNIPEGKPKLLKLRRTLDDALNENGIEREQRKFQPHITIAREVVLSERMNSISPFPVYQSYVHVNAITLFESRREHGVLTYVPIHETLLEETD